MNASFQILISVGISGLPEAPLIADSPFYKRPQTAQPQTGWVVLSEACRTWPGGSACRRTCSGRLGVHCLLLAHRACQWVQRWRWRGQHTLLEKIQLRHDQSLPTVILESLTSISFDLPQEHEWTGHFTAQPKFLSAICWSVLFFKKAVVISKNA